MVISSNCNFYKYMQLVGRGNRSPVVIDLFSVVVKINIEGCSSKVNIYGILHKSISLSIKGTQTVLTYSSSKLYEKLTSASMSNTYKRFSVDDLIMIFGSGIPNEGYIL